MKIEWDDPEPARPGKQRALSLWEKVRNSISVLKPEPGTLPPVPRRSNSDPRGTNNSRSQSHSRSPSSPRHHSQSPSRSYQPHIRVQTGNGSPQPISPTKGYTYAISPGGAVRRSTQPPVAYHSTPRSPQRSGNSTPVRSTPRRSATAPPNGVMYNGKLIVGNPKDVDRYISSQRRIENWVNRVR